MKFKSKQSAAKEAVENIVNEILSFAQGRVLYGTLPRKQKSKIIIILDELRP